MAIMIWRRCPGLLAVLLGPLVDLPGGHSLIGRLIRIRLLLAVRLLRPIRYLALVGRLALPLVWILVAVRIPWRLFAHDALPCAAAPPRPL